MSQATVELEQGPATGEDWETTEVPPEAAMVMSALEAGGRVLFERRRCRRRVHRTTAMLRLFSDDPTAPPRRLYTRDISRRALGFICNTPLPLSHGGVVEMHDHYGNPISLHCTLLRCRLTAPGWYEGTLYFNRDQPQFDPA